MDCLKTNSLHDIKRNCHTASTVEAHIRSYQAARAHRPDTKNYREAPTHDIVGIARANTDPERPSETG